MVHMDDHDTNTTTAQGEDNTVTSVTDFDLGEACSITDTECEACQ